MQSNFNSKLFGEQRQLFVRLWSCQSLRFLAAIRLEAIANRLEAIAIRLEAIAIRLEAIASSNSKECFFCCVLVLQAVQGRWTQCTLTREVKRDVVILFTLLSLNIYIWARELFGAPWEAIHVQSFDPNVSNPSTIHLIQLYHLIQLVHLCTHISFANISTIYLNISNLWHSVEGGGGGGVGGDFWVGGRGGGGGGVVCNLWHSVEGEGGRGGG